MKILRLIILVLIPLLVLHESSAQTYSWARSVNGEKEIRLEAMTSDREESIVAVGFFMDTIYVEGRRLISYGDKDILLVSYNSSGDTLWCKHIGSKEEDRAKDITTDEDGNIYVTGSFSDSALFDGRYLRSTSDNQDIFLAKYTADGDSLWIKNVGTGYGLDRGNGITIGNNEIHMIGFFDSTLQFETDTLFWNGYTNNFVASFDLSGNYNSSMHIKKYNNDARLNSISTAKDGGCLISGFFIDTVRFTDASETEYEYYGRSPGKADIFVMRMLPSKIVAWARTAGSDGDDQGMDARSDIEGSIYVTGYYSGTADFDSTDTQVSTSLSWAGSEDIFVTKYNSEGRLLWKRGFGGVGSDIGRRLDYFNEKVVFTGHISDTIVAGNDTLATTGPTDNDTGFGLTNDGGDFISFSQIRGDGIDRGMSIINDKYDAVYIVGFYRSTELYVGNDTLDNMSPGQKEGFIAKGVWPLSLAETDRTNISCNGLADGSLTVTPYFGEGPFTFEWEHDGELTDSTATGLPDGQYKVICTDALGYKDSLIMNLDEPSEIFIDKVITDALCNGSSDGQIDITPSGGTPGYSYDWVAVEGVLGRPSTEQDQTGLIEGTYSVTVTDHNGCTRDSTFAIEEPDVIETDISKSDITGAGNDGSIDLTVSGGTAPYNYSWTGPNGYVSSDEDLGSLADGGTYYLTVTDNNGCTAGDLVTLLEPGLLIIQLDSLLNIKCKGDANGFIRTTVTGGTPHPTGQRYTYHWDPNVSSDSSATDLDAGTYRIVVEDETSATDTLFVTIEEPDELQYSFIPTNVSCNGEADGKVDVVWVGGTLPYTYLWDNMETTPNIEGLGFGQYKGVRTDANGCKDSVIAYIFEPTQIDITETVTPITCTGDRDGKIILDIVGGTPDYQGNYNILWSNTLTSDSIDYLLPGYYTYEVTDSNGCLETNTLEIIEPDLISGTFTDVMATCYGLTNGQATVVAAGGTGSYSYEWDDALSQTSATATNLAAGDYEVTITDENACTGTEGTSIAQNPQIIVSKDSSDAIVCEGFTNGAVYITTTGGTAGYTYLWSTNAATEDLTDVGPGSYTLTVTDALNCQVPAGPFTVEDISTPIVITASLADSTSCNGTSDGSITVSTWDGSAKPHKFSINDGASFQADTLFTGLAAGSYITVVTDSVYGCIKYGDTLNVKEPDMLEIGNLVIVHPSTADSQDGSITVTPSGGTAPYQYSFNLGAYGALNDTTALDTGIYVVMVKDIHGCGPVDSTVTLERQNVSVGEVMARDVLIYPNPSSGAFTLELENSDREDIMLEIVDITGRMIYKKLHKYDGQGRFIRTIDIGDAASGTCFIRVNGWPVKAKLMIKR